MLISGNGNHHQAGHAKPTTDPREPVSVSVGLFENQTAHPRVSALQPMKSKKRLVLSVIEHLPYSAVPQVGSGWPVFRSSGLSNL